MLFVIGVANLLPWAAMAVAILGLFGPRLLLASL